MFFSMVNIKDLVYDKYISLFDNETNFIKIGVWMIAVYNYEEVQKFLKKFVHDWDEEY